MISSNKQNNYLLVGLPIRTSQHIYKGKLMHNEENDGYRLSSNHKNYNINFFKVNIFISK